MQHQGMDRKAMRAEFDKLSTPERLDRMQAMADKRHARMAERAEAIKALYAQLTPEQQKVFDAEAMPGGHHGGHRFHRRPGRVRVRRSPAKSRQRRSPPPRRRDTP